jgi:hypothetical protein
MSGPAAEGAKSALGPPRQKAIVVGVTDLRSAAALPPFDASDVEVTLEDSKGKRLSPAAIKPGPGRSMVARFVPLEPGKYTAHASLRESGVTEGVARPKTVALGKGPQAEVDLDLEFPPELIVVSGEFLGDHRVMRRPQDKINQYTRKDTGKVLQSGLGNGGGAAKPELDVSDNQQNPSADQGVWHPATYTFGEKVRVRLTLRVALATPGSWTLEEARLATSLESLTLTEKVSPPRPLLDGELIEVELEAEAPLAKRIALLDEPGFLSLTASGAPVKVVRRRHRLRVFSLFGKPTGKLAMHTIKTTEPLPEKGSDQQVTFERLRRVVERTQGATTEEQAVRQLFARLSGVITYNGEFAFPELDERDNNTALNPKPQLHEHFWIAIEEPRYCHCLDLAGGMRLWLRMLGVTGSMDVEMLFPWPQWDHDGSLRDLTGDEPWQGSLRRFRFEDLAELVFFDADEKLNFFEAVLRWVPPGSERALLCPVGEPSILDRFGPDVSPGSMDDRNASLFYQSAPFDPVPGKFKLGAFVRPAGVLRKAFPFMKHRFQMLFEFDYDQDTFQSGDDRQVVGDGLQKT